MEFEILAQTVEKWIYRFWTDLQQPSCSRPSSYHEITDDFWQLIWICIAKLKGDGSDGDQHIRGPTTLTRDMQYESLIIEPTGSIDLNGFDFYCNGDFLDLRFHPQLLIVYTYLHTSGPSSLKQIDNILISKIQFSYDSELTKRRLLKIFNEFETPFTINVQDKREWRRSYYFDAPELKILTLCPGKSQNYVYFLQCLLRQLGFSFHHSNFFRPGTNLAVTSFRLGKGRRPKPIEAYAYWSMQLETYQKCLQLFPRWPLKMSLEWHRETRKLCELYLIPDLVSICLAFL